jgi:anti-anti-sigma factor
MSLEQDGLAGLGWDGHLLLLHGSERERRSQLAVWVRRGLERDEQVIYGQDDTVAPQRSILAVLAQQGVDVSAATAKGRLLVRPLAAVYGDGPGGQVERIKRALAEGYRGVRTSGEATAARTGAPEEIYAGLAGSLEQLCRTYPVSALCQYDRATTSAGRLEQAVATHGGLRESQLHTAQADGRLQLAGQVDASNEPVLLAAVQAATSTALGRFWLDLRRVATLSVGGCRALVIGTQQFRERGGQVVLLVAPQAIVERVLRLVGLDAVNNVEITGKAP